MGVRFSLDERRHNHLLIFLHSERQKIILIVANICLFVLTFIYVCINLILNVIQKMQKMSEKQRHHLSYQRFCVLLGVRKLYCQFKRKEITEVKFKKAGLV